MMEPSIQFEFDWFSSMQLPILDGEDLKSFNMVKTKRGARTQALVKLCHICIERGMGNAQVMGYLIDADDRWGKFKGRKDRIARLSNIIDYCRTQHSE